MTPRIWDRFLTERDRAHEAASVRNPVGFGERPALLLIDNYRWVFGNRREPLLAAIETWPGSVGEVAWDAIERCRELLAVSREVQIPIVHVTGLEDMDSGVWGWSVRRDGSRRAEKRLAEASPAELDRLRRRYDIVEQVAPLPGEAVLRKASPSAFWGTPLVGHLNYNNIDTLIVCGESTSGCVRASVVDGTTNRYRVIVAEECVYDRTEASHAINLFDMHQKYADVLPLAEITDWLRAWRVRQGAAAPEPALAGASSR